jgi:hypothetical protein
MGPGMLKSITNTLFKIAAIMLIKQVYKMSFLIGAGVNSGPTRKLVVVKDIAPLSFIGYLTKSGTIPQVLSYPMKNPCFK